MNSIDSGVWFVYDGDCPLCGYAAQALEIKKQCGELHLVDARSHAGHPLILEINSRNLDLDEGMVIYWNGRFYHGKDALRFMAKHGHPHGFFNNINRWLFQSDTLATFFYPGLRGVRNFLLRRLGKSKIDNLKRSEQPIFTSVFGDRWDKLPAVLKHHYANRPYCRGKVIVEGKLDVYCRSYMKILSPFFRVLGTVPTMTEKQVPVTVHFDSSEHSSAFYFNRVFNFSESKPYHFRSRMIPLGNGEVFEIMRFGICWRTRFDCDSERVTLTHRGYAIKILNFYLPLPITWLIGRGDAEEIAVDDDHFDMKVEMTSPVFGLVYSYAGRFKVVKSL